MKIRYRRSDRDMYKFKDVPYGSVFKVTNNPSLYMRLNYSKGEMGVSLASGEIALFGLIEMVYVPDVEVIVEE